MSNYHPLAGGPFLAGECFSVGCRIFGWSPQERGPGSSTCSTSTCFWWSDLAEPLAPDFPSGALPEMHRVVQVTNLFTKTHNEILKSKLAKEDVQQFSLWQPEHPEPTIIYNNNLYYMADPGCNWNQLQCNRGISPHLPAKWAPWTGKFVCNWADWS